MKIALGTAQFGLDYGVLNHNGQVTINEVHNILDLAENIGIDTLDTAAGYGNSEQTLGKVGVDNYQIITKTSPIKLGVDNVISDFHKSLERLGLARVEGLLIHNIDDINSKQFDALFNRLNQLKRQGLVNKIGFSTYTPEHVDFLLENFDFDLVQLPFNVFDVRLIEGGQLKALKNKGVEVHSRSVFLQGVLLDFSNLPSYFATWKGQFNEYQEIVKGARLSLLEYSLNFALNVKEIDKILVGANSEDQLKEIIQATHIRKDASAYPINDVNLLNPSLWKV
jgi:aryl-alcohol dehydrogenase-like predicted oxidoreductase